MSSIICPGNIFCQVDGVKRFFRFFFTLHNILYTYIRSVRWSEYCTPEKTTFRRVRGQFIFNQNAIKLVRRHRMLPWTKLHHRIWWFRISYTALGPTIWKDDILLYVHTLWNTYLYYIDSLIGKHKNVSVSGNLWKVSAVTPLSFTLLSQVTKETDMLIKYYESDPFFVSVLSSIFNIFNYNTNINIYILIRQIFWTLLRS